MDSLFFVIGKRIVERTLSTELNNIEIDGDSDSFNLGADSDHEGPTEVDENDPFNLGADSEDDCQTGNDLVKKTLGVNDPFNLGPDSDDEGPAKSGVVHESLGTGDPFDLCAESDDEEDPKENDFVDRSVNKSTKKSSSERLEILKSFLDRDIIFLPADPATASNDMTKTYTNTQWLAESSSRKVIVCGNVYLYEKSKFFWQNHQFTPKTLVLYNDLLVIGRDPKNAAEIRSGWNDPNYADMFASISDRDLLQSFLIAESVIDLKMCKLRRSSLTTPSSVEDVKIDEASQDDPDLRQKCFEIVAPTQNFFISAVDANVESEKISRDNRALFLTSQWEENIKDTLCAVHSELHQSSEADKSWIHQIILGTLHSHIVSGNYKILERAISGKGNQTSPYPGIDLIDDNGLTALHYACNSRSNHAVTVLLHAGADSCKPTVKGRKTPCHISAERLDAMSLSTILSQTHPSRPDANALDENGFTPMTVAVLKGRGPGGTRSASSLNMCIASLQAWGGYLHVPYSPHPIHTLSAEWCQEELEIVFPTCDYEFPVVGNGMDGYGQSLSAIFDYPLHTCLSQLRLTIAKIGKTSRVFPPQTSSEVPSIVR